MIIMGDQRHNGFEKILAGDVLAKILNNAEIPILIIPTDEQNISRIAQQQDTLQYI
jgi:nucleotide-binding universal stress UspA family protein